MHMCICFSSCGLVTEEGIDSGSDIKKQQDVEGSSSLYDDNYYYAAPKAVLNAKEIKETKWDYDIKIGRASCRDRVSAVV